MALQLIGSLTPATASFTISLKGSHEKVAPYPAFFEVDNDSIAGFDSAKRNFSSAAAIYDESYHNIDWTWTVTRPVGASGTYQTNGLNIPTSFNDRNVMRGKLAGFCFDAPGDYFVYCYGIDKSGNWASASYTFQSGGDSDAIADPDTYYAGTRTVAWNPVGDTDFSWKPTGAQEVNTWSAAEAATRASSQTYRILLKRGATYAITQELRESSSTFIQNMRIGAGGTGARPIVNSDLAFTFDNLFEADFTNSSNLRYDHWILYDLDLRGQWNDLKEIGLPYDGVNIAGICAPILLHNVTLDGFKIGIWNDHGATANANLAPQLVMISEVEIPSSRSYGIYTGSRTETNGRLVVVGTSVRRNTGALNGINNSRTHGVGNGDARVRYIWHPMSVWSCCDFFNRCSANPGSGSAVKPPVGADACFRMITSIPKGSFASVTLEQLPYLYMERCTLEGGGSDAQIELRNYQLGTGLEIPVNIVLERNLHVTSAQTAKFFQWAYSGVTVRSSIFYAPYLNLTGAYETNNTGVVQYQVGQAADCAHPTYDPHDKPIRFYNNTFYLDIDPAANNSKVPTLENADVTSGGIIFGPATFSDILYENNIFETPRTTPADTDDAPLTSTALAGFTPRFGGFRWDDAADALMNTGVTLGSDVGPGGTFTIAYPNDRNGNPLGASDFDASGYHFLRSNGLNKTYWNTDFSLTFGASEITVQNDSSGDTWASGTTVGIKPERANASLMAIDATTANPANVPQLVPDTGSAAIDNATAGSTARLDFVGATRPGWKGLDQLLVAGTPSRGAHEA